MAEKTRMKKSPLRTGGGMDSIFGKNATSKPGVRARKKRTKYPKDEFKKHGFIVSYQNLWALQDKAYWDRQDISQAINEILEGHFKHNKYKESPNRIEKE